MSVQSRPMQVGPASLGIPFTYEGIEYTLKIWDYEGNESDVEVWFKGHACDYEELRMTVTCRTSHFATDVMDAIDGIVTENVIYIGYPDESGW